MQNTAGNNDCLNQSAEKECLDAILKTTKMGIYSMNVLFSKMKKNEKILNFLLKQVELYKFVEKNAEELAKKCGVEGYSIPLCQKLPVRCSVAMQLFFDDSESHIAKMTLKGLEMGVIELIEVRNKFKGKVSRECEELLSTLLLRLDTFDDEMKSFL